MKSDSAMDKGRTIYSPEIPGERGNHGLASRFDLTDGFLGITQRDGDAVQNRVLLSPKQLRELVTFVTKQKQERDRGRRR